MKQYIAAGALILLALCSTVNGFAQSGDPSARADQMKQKLVTDLKMTQVQADSVVAINSSYRPQFMAIYQDPSLSQDDKKAKMKNISEQADMRLQPVLGDSLLAKYKDWRKENMQQMRGAKSGN